MNAPFSWSLLDLSSVNQTSDKQVSKQLAESILNSENMDNFTALCTSYLIFTDGTSLLHASPRAFGTFVSFPALLQKFMLLEFQVKNTVGTVDHVQLRDKHGRVNRSPTALSRSVIPTLRIST